MPGRHYVPKGGPTNWPASAALIGTSALATVTRAALSIRAILAGTSSLTGTTGTGPVFSGWTNWTPTLTGGNTSVTQQEGTGYPGSGTRLIYVSTSGNDANPGTLAAPKATISGGVAAIRAGFPDWCLLKKGDTFNLGTGNVPGKAGPGPATPIILGTYDPSQPGVVDPIVSGGSRAHILCDNDPVISTAWDNAAFTGIHFKSITPRAGEVFHWTGSAAYPPSPPSSFPPGTLAGNWTWWENCLIEGYDRNVYEAGYGKFTFNRCIFIDCGAFGIYADRVEDPNLIDCIFDNDSSGGQSPAVRNIYLEQSNVKATVSGLITSRSGSTGIQIRPNNSFISDSLSVLNTLAYQVGCTTGNDPPGFVTNNMSIKNCVAMEGTDLPGTPQKIGIAMYQQQSSVNGAGSTCIADGNVMCFQNGTAPFFSACAFDIEQCNNVLVKNNIGFNWRPEVLPPPIIGSEAATGNTYMIRDENQATSTYVNNNWDPLGSNNNPLGNAPAEPYPDPNRNLSTYMTSLGQSPATTLGFLNKARAQSKDNWNVAYMAQAVNTYINAGFGR